MGLTGAAIEVDHGTNHLSIDGPGQMDITMTDDLEGSPLPAPCRLTVDWRRCMYFNGRRALRAVVVASTPGMFSQTDSQTEMTQFRLNTNTMDVRCSDRSRFPTPRPTKTGNRGDSLQWRRGGRQPLPSMRGSDSSRDRDAGHRSGDQPATHLAAG